MLDSRLRPLIDPPLNRAGAAMVRCGIGANTVTLIGFLFACGAFTALGLQLYPAALGFILLSRIADGLDGAVARHSPKGPSDLGAFFDIVSDFIFYGGIVFFFALGRPQEALAAAFLLFSFMGTASSFLTANIIAEKRGLSHEKQGRKSFYYAAGLCEGSETIFFFILFCLFPAHFGTLALIFGALCWVTTAGRIAQSVKLFRAL